jgi:glycerate kinase
LRVVIAPDKFKGSLEAPGVAAALAAGIRDVVPGAVCVLVPMADGGDGTVAAFLTAGARAVWVVVPGPLGRPVQAEYARDDDTTIMEMAAASGLAVEAAREPRQASTAGTGVMLRDALERGARRIVLGIGGSATTDGGAGALAALGARFFDPAGAALTATPAGLADVAKVDLGGLHPRLGAVDLAVACDVDNPLLGPNGAAAVYGPQKGARPDDITFLDGVLARLADAMQAATGRDLREVPGAGAAGGLGWALASACGARLERGVQLVAEVRGLPGALQGADWCFTGEGRIDAQTLRGKVVDGVGQLAAAAKVPVVAFGGSVDPAAEVALRARGVACFPIAPGPITFEAALRDTALHLRAAAARVTELIRAGADLA